MLDQLIRGLVLSTTFAIGQALREREKVCGNCGTKVSSKDKYCKKCGSDDIVTRKLYKIARTKEAREAYFFKEEKKRQQEEEKRRKEKGKEIKSAMIKETNKIIMNIRNDYNTLVNSKFCTSCNKIYGDKSFYCSKCGMQIEHYSESEILNILRKKHPDSVSSHERLQELLKKGALMK